MNEINVTRTHQKNGRTVFARLPGGEVVEMDLLEAAYNDEPEGTITIMVSATLLCAAYSDMDALSKLQGR